MLFTSLLAGLSAVVVVTAYPKAPIDINPFVGKNYYANSHYAGELDQTLKAFLAEKDYLNAARVRTVQHTGTFLWITTVSAIPDIATAIKEARAVKKKTGQPQIVELVLYDLPDRDCSAGASAGEFSSAADGAVGALNKYKHQFIDAYAAALSKAPDLTFAIILEPDSLGNVITNQNIPFCTNATPIYEAGIAYAIAKLQQPNVYLYIDAAHGGWLGWDGNLPLGKYHPLKMSNINLTL